MRFVPTNELLSLSGKTAVVTGAGRGIGRSIARRLADAGAAVVACDLTEELCHDTVQLVREEGGTITAVGGDISKMEEIHRVVASGVSAFGAVDILVNNAALRGFVTWDSLTEADWDRFMAVNIKAVFFMSQAIAKHMISGGRGGAIVNIASTAAVHPVRQKVDYNAAKAGVASLTKSLAVELGPHNIRVNAVGPGATNTEGGSAGQSAEQARQLANGWISRLALPVRFAEPDDIARAVLFLASEAASYITAQVLYVDAGYLAG